MASVTLYWTLVRDNADFRRLYLARLISFAGDWFLIVPLVGLVYDMSGSTLAASAVIAAHALPALLLAPFTGTFADRFDRKKILIISDLVRAGLVLSLLAADTVDAVWFPLIVIALDGAGAAFFYPASGAALPNVVDSEDLGAANVLMSSAWGAMLALGAALGGFVAAVFSRDAAFAANAATFVVSAVLISRIGRRLQQEDRTVSDRFFEATKAALVYASDHRSVAALVTAKAGHALTSGGAVGLFAVLSIVVFDTGDGGTGVLFGARGLGNLFGPIIAFHLFGSSLQRVLGTIGYAMALWGLGYLFVGAAPSLALAALAIGIAHMGGGTMFTFSTYGLQELSPDQIRGRIFALDFGLDRLLFAISALAVGSAAEIVSIRTLLIGLGAAGLVFGLVWAAATRHLWAATVSPTP